MDGGRKDGCMIVGNPCEKIGKRDGAELKGGPEARKKRPAEVCPKGVCARRLARQRAREAQSLVRHAAEKRKTPESEESAGGAYALKLV